MKKEVKVKKIINVEVLRTLIILNKAYTYKELCDMEVFYNYYSGGNGKKNQFTELAIYCKYSKAKVKGSYIIKEIYTQLQIINQLSYSQLQNDIQLLVLDKLAKADKNNIIITTGALMGDCGMINTKYFCKIEDIAYTLKIEKDIVADILSLTNNTNTGYIKRSLNGLKDKGIILLEYMLFINKMIFKEVNEDGTPNKNGEFDIENRQATQEEKDIFADLQSETMEEMGIDSLKELYKAKNTTLRLAYYKRLNKKLRKHDIYTSYYAYNITASKRFVLKELSKRKSMDIKSNLNKSVLDDIFNKIETKAVTKDIEKYNTSDVDEWCSEDEIQKEIDMNIDKIKDYNPRAKANYIDDGKEVAKIVISAKSKKQIKKAPNEKVVNN